MWVTRRAIFEVKMEKAGMPIRPRGLKYITGFPAAARAFDRCANKSDGSISTRLQITNSRWWLPQWSGSGFCMHIQVRRDDLFAWMWIGRSIVLQSSNFPHNLAVPDNQPYRQHRHVDMQKHADRRISFTFSRTSRPFVDWKKKFFRHVLEDRLIANLIGYDILCD